MRGSRRQAGERRWGRKPPDRAAHGSSRRNSAPTCFDDRPAMAAAYNREAQVETPSAYPCR